MRADLFGFQMVMDARYQSEQNAHKMFQSAVQTALFELKILSNLKLLRMFFCSNDDHNSRPASIGLLTPAAYDR